MSETVQLGFMVAFAAGVLSFLSPCVLPLVPSYIGFVAGMSAPEAVSRRRLAVLHSGLFVLGFSIVFMLLGVTATALGQMLNAYQVWLQRIGAVLIIAFGLYCLGIFRLGFLEREQRIHLEDKPVGYLGSVLVGMAFAAGWTPCIGPVLGGILGLAATQADMSRGLVLLGAYSLGLAVPFLLAAFALDSFLNWFKNFRRHLGVVQKASGVLLIVVGVLLLTGEFTKLAGWLQTLTPEFLRERL